MFNEIVRDHGRDAPGALKTRKGPEEPGQLGLWKDRIVATNVENVST